MELKVNNLSLSYGDHQVLNNISCQLKSGYVYGLVGVNGSGKTTLFNCISGLSKDRKGTIELENLPVLTNQVAYLESTLFAYPGMTGRDYLLLFAVENSSFSIDKWNAIFNLPLDEYISNYSSGMQKKLGLMGILALDRNVILLDEPFNALDLEAVELLKQILPEIGRRNKIVIVSSHIFETLADTCDFILYLQQGCITRMFPKSEFSDLQISIQSHIGDKYKKDIQEVIGKTRML